MGKRHLVWLCVCALVVACGKNKDDDKSAKPTPSKPAPDKTGPSKPSKPQPPAPPKADPKAVEQCQRILGKTWLAAKAVLVKLQTKNVDEVKPTYERWGKSFVKNCATLAADKRDCVEKSSNAANGLNECNVNAGRRKNKIWAVDTRRAITQFKPAKLDPAVAKKQLADLAGTWVNDWKQLKQVTTWIIAADGALTIKQVSPKAKKDQPTDDGIKGKVWFEQAGRLHVKKGTTTQPYVYLRTDKNTFYVANNLIYGAFPIPNRNKFLLKAGWDFVSHDKGKCEVFSARGEVAKATCKFTRDKGKPVFKVEYQYPGKMSFRGTPIVVKRTFLVVGKHLLHESLVSIGKFVRKK